MADRTNNSSNERGTDPQDDALLQRFNALPWPGTMPAASSGDRGGAANNRGARAFGGRGGFNTSAQRVCSTPGCNNTLGSADRHKCVDCRFGASRAASPSPPRRDRSRSPRRLRENATGSRYRERQPAPGSSKLLLPSSRDGPVVRPCKSCLDHGREAKATQHYDYECPFANAQGRRSALKRARTERDRRLAADNQGSAADATQEADSVEGENAKPGPRNI